VSSFVISDVHGHLADLRAVLAKGGLIDDKDRWTGTDDELWMLGDLVDRGQDGIGVIRLMRQLQEQAPDRVHVLMGNHEALMIGYHLFPDTRFAEVWLVNGGRHEDQEALTDDEVAWLRGLPPMALAHDHLLMHSDITSYLGWGSSVEEVNATVAELVGGDDAQRHFDVFATLTDRYDFARRDGADAARKMLSTFGGRRLVHGHSIIGSLIDVPSAEVEGPITYADELVMAIDGGRYDGGPLLLVRLT
jgi:Calcineurin-like phosphoesterase